MNAAIEVVVVAPKLLNDENVKKVVEESNLKKIVVNDVVFASLSRREHPSGIGGVVNIPEMRLSDIEIEDDTLAAVFEEPRDPKNLGVGIRTLECVGGTDVVILGNAVDPYDPGCIQSSAGSIFSVNVIPNIDVAEFLDWRQNAGFRFIGTSPHVEKHYRDISYHRPLAITFGTEQIGLSKALMAAMDEVVSIPIVGRCASLHLSSAVAVLAYQALDAYRVSEDSPIA